MLNKKRSTLETKIEVSLAENKSVAESKLETGIGFFDHMLTLFSFHSDLYLEVKAKGDLEVDYHHTVEDVGIVLGQLIRELYLNKPSY